MKKYQRHSSAQWQSLIEDQATSGLSATQFCKQYQIGYASFCAWRKNLTFTASSTSSKNHTPTPEFVELTPSPNSTAIQPWAVELQVGADLILRIAKV